METSSRDNSLISTWLLGSLFSNNGGLHLPYDILAFEYQWHLKVLNSIHRESNFLQVFINISQYSLIPVSAAVSLCSSFSNNSYLHYCQSTSTSTSTSASASTSEST
ncbi:hypothetical protein ACTA71_009726 [Dictyostelium dimigraforme]